MYTLNGAILAATGGPTVNDGLVKYYGLNGGVGTTLNDLEMSFLASKGFAVGTDADRWMAYLKSLGYTGTINGMMLTYWNSLAAQAPSVDFTGTPLQVVTGGSCTLNWLVEGGVTITASATPANAQWTGAKAASGSLVINNLTANQRFTLAATNPNGTTTINVDVVVVAQTAIVNVTVGQDATPDYFGFNSLAGYGAANPTAIFGGNLTVLVSGWNGFDEILVANTGNVPFPDIGTAQIRLTADGGGGNAGPFDLTWNGTTYRRASNLLAYYLSTKVGQVVVFTLEKL